MTRLQLRHTPLLARVGADRADELRTDIDAAQAGWPDAALLRIDSRNRVMIAGNHVVLARAVELGDKPPQDAVFLGRIPDGRHVWGIRADLEPQDGAEVLDLLRAGQAFDDVSAQLVATAAALLNWHDTGRFSPVDGMPTKPVRAG